jgi:hypothetical protein
MNRITSRPAGKPPGAVTVRRNAWIWPLLAAALLVIDKIINLRSFSFAYTDFDAAMFWYAAEDLLHGHVRTPFWYGNRHNTLIEGFLSAPLLALGVSHEKAIPITAGAIQLAPWLFLFIASSRRRDVLGMTLAAVFPVLLVREYQLLAGFGAGIACATPAAWLARGEQSDRFGPWFGIAASWGIAYVLNPNSALISVPTAVASLASPRTRIRQSAAVAAGLASAALLWGAMQAYYWFDPLAGTGGTPEVELRFSLFAESLRSLDALWVHLLPVMTRTHWAYPALWSLALALALYLRDAWAARWVLAGALLVFASLALTIIRYGSLNVFYSYSRFYFALPVFTVFALLFSIRKAGLSQRSATVLAMALCIVGIGSLVIKHRASTQSNEYITRAPLINVRITPTAPLLEHCQMLGNLVSRLGVQAIFALDEPVLIGGCGARLYGLVEVTGPRDPRLWVLRRVARLEDGAFVLTDAPPDFCEGLPASSRCRFIPIANVTLFETRGTGPIELLRSRGVVFREF